MLADDKKFDTEITRRVLIRWENRKIVSGGLLDGEMNVMIKGNVCIGPLNCYLMLFLWKFDTHLLITLITYVFVTLFFWEI